MRDFQEPIARMFLSNHHITYNLITVKLVLIWNKVWFVLSWPWALYLMTWDLIGRRHAHSPSIITNHKTHRDTIDNEHSIRATQNTNEAANQWLHHVWEHVRADDQYDQWRWCKLTTAAVSTNHMSIDHRHDMNTIMTQWCTTAHRHVSWPLNAATNDHDQVTIEVYVAHVTT